MSKLNEERNFDPEEILEEEQEVKQEAQTFDKPRVQKLMLLGGMIVNEKKTGRAKGVNLVFIDSITLDQATGQPELRGFSPTLTMYVGDKDKAILDQALALLRQPVFSIIYAKISGNENFYRFHGTLTAEQVAVYRQLMDDLL